MAKFLQFALWNDNGLTQNTELKNIYLKQTDWRDSKVDKGN
jgi:hypothetical protein